MRLSIVIPAYNEADRISPLLDAVEKDLSALDDDYEVIVVDDGSTDGTAELLEARRVHLVVQDRNRGKAAAVQRGIAESTGRYVAVLDADLEYAPSDMLALLEDADLQQARRGGPRPAVYGSRYLHRPNFRSGVAGKLRILRGQELTSWLANWTLTALVLVLFGRFITDTLTGLKLYPGDFLRSQRLTSTGFEGDHEITARLVRAGVPIREVPIAYFPRSRQEGKKIGPRDGVVAVLTFVKFRFY